MSFRKKILIILLLVVYNLSYLLNIFQYAPFKAHAEDVLESANIVAVFVDKDLQGSLNDNLKWYTSNYIQQNIVNSKALVFPINKNNFSAKDISKILENLYLEGESNKTTKLIGTVLIGDLPMPVVKRDNFIFPSIYPYVDFRDKKFVFNPSTDFFEYRGNDNAQPEIWHGVINFGNDTNQYNNFFQKLKKYTDNPSEFAEKKIWYEDFIYLKKLFVPNNMGYYLNSILYSEDIAYKRYTNLLFNLLSYDYKKFLEDGIKNSSLNIENLKKEADLQLSGSDSEFKDLKSFNDIYFSKINSFKNSFMNTSFLDTLSGSYDKIPTLMIEQSLSSFLKPYNEVFGNIYFNKLKDSVEASGRWNVDNAESHVDKVYVRDEFTKSLIVEYNNSLEKAIDKKISDEKYYMSLPVATKHEEWQSICPADETSSSGGGSSSSSSSGGSGASVTWKLNGKYENFYFGKNALDINYAGDFSIFRGTFKNFTKASSASGLQNTNIDDVNINPSNATVGASNGISSRQIEANRAYNIAKSQVDSQVYMNNRCNNAETMEQWLQRWYGGNSPLNLKMSGSADYLLGKTDSKDAWNPSFNKSVGGPVFDIAGSTLTTGNQLGAGYLGYKTNSSMVRVQKSQRVGGGSSESYQTVNDYQCQTSPKDRIGFDETNFFDVFNKSSLTAGDFMGIYLTGANGQNQDTRGSTTCLCQSSSSTGRPYNSYNGSVQKEIASTSRLYLAESDSDSSGGSFGGSDSSTRSGGGENSCIQDYNKKLIYDYKTVNSTIYHKSPTTQELNGLNYTSFERPVDDPRYVSFLGLGGDEVKMIYPDLFRVEAYYTSGDRQYLKSQTDIETALKEYLKAKAVKYNQDLQAQLEKKGQFYSSNKNAYDFLATADSTATPNRSYNLIDENFLVNLLGDENIKRVAASIYYQNIGWPEKKQGTDFLSTIEALKGSFNINKKILYVEDKYIRSDSSADPITNVNYSQKGYEAGYINSDGIDTVDTTKVPDMISKLQALKANISGLNGKVGLEELKNLLMANKESQECGVSSDGSVMIFQWPSAFMCWMTKTMQKPVALTIDFGCSLGSLFSDDEDNPQSIFGDFGGNNVLNTPTAILATDFLRKQHSIFIQKYAVDKWPGYISNWKPWLSIDQTANDKILSALSELQKNDYRNIQNNVTVSIMNDPNMVVDDEMGAEKKYVKIGSLKDIGDVSIDIAAVGDNCILLNNTDICKTNLSLKLNPFKTESLLPITLRDHKAGTTVLQVKICKGDICEYRNKSLNLIPSKLSNITVNSAEDKAVRGGKLPFSVKGYDKYGNEINQIAGEYVVTPSMGKLDVNGTLLDSVSVSNFKDAYFLLDSSDLSGVAADQKVDISLKVEPSSLFYELDKSLPSASKTISVIPSSASVKSGTADVSSIQYSLPDDFSGLYTQDQNGLYQLNEASLLKYRIELKGNDGTSLNSPVTITSSNGLMYAGNVVNAKKYLYSGNVSINQKDFQQSENFMISNGVLEFYLHPSLTAGSDNITISIPGISDIVIPMRVYPASPVSTKIITDKDKVNINERLEGRIFVEDTWGNTVDNRETTVQIGTIGNMKANGQSDITLKTTTGIVTVDLSTQDPGGKSYIYSTLKDLPLESQIPDYKSIIVVNKLWPSEKLNIMYLSLFGSDWGNMWNYFSDKNNVSSNILSNSDKTLAITTQSVDPQSVKGLSYMITQDLNLFNFENSDIVFGFSGNNIVYKFGQNSVIGMLDVGNGSDYNLIRSETIAAAGDNGIYYTAEPVDSIITSNTIENKSVKVNNEAIIDFSRGYLNNETSIVSDSNLSTAKQLVFSVHYKNKIVGYLTIRKNNDALVKNYPSNLILTSSYSSAIGFAQGSTNGKKSIMIYTDVNNLSSATKGYDSVEDSFDEQKDIGFKADFKNITNFADGLNVGEASKGFASEYVINFGDPVLTRINKNQLVDKTNFDLGVGKKIYSDSKNGDILKSVSMDFNNDGLKDLVVSYTDGSIRLLKNYGGNEGFENIGDLMVISDGIKDIRAGDVDGNGYEDIIIRTRKDMLRVYTNNNGVFDLNGRLICLDLIDGPSSVASVSQIFFKDMNLDNKIDIVTSDIEQKIKIFYGGSSDKGANYISNDIYSCDSGWLDRQKDNQKTVKSYVLQISTGQKVLDDSYIHRNGLVNPTDIKGNVVASQNTTLDQLTSQVSQITGTSITQEMAYQELPSTFKPVYEVNAENFDYYKISHLDGTHPMEVYKKYVDLNGGMLVRGDAVKIEIHIRGNKDKKATYIESLNGPWVIQRDENYQLSGFDRGNLSRDSIINWNIDGYQFMIDNILVSSSQETVFSYMTYYSGKDPMKIEVEKINEDNYPDIKVYSNDSCIKGYFTFIAENNASSYREKFEGLVDKYIKEVEDLKDQRNKILKDVGDTIKQVSGDIQNIDKLLGMTESSKLDLGGYLDVGSDEGGDMDLSLNVDLLGAQTQGLKSQISSVVKNLCKGFNFGSDSGCQPGLPIPFNNAFLAPGIPQGQASCLSAIASMAGVDLDGVTNEITSALGLDFLNGPSFGLPVFFFPGTAYMPGPVPVPNGLKSPADLFTWVPGGVYPSMTRLYVAPTLTMSLGFAACFGPYGAGMIAPTAPFGSIAGNCVVAAMPLSFGSCKKPATGQFVLNGLKDRQYEMAKIGSCNKTNPNKTSPFVLMTTDGAGLNVPVAWEGEYFNGIVNIDEPVREIQGGTFAGGIGRMESGPANLKSGKNVALKIEGGSAKGIFACIIQKWLDNQIRYIINNLTSMTLYVYYPDFDNVTKGFDKLKSGISSVKGAFNGYGDSVLGSVSNLTSSTDNSKYNTSEQNKKEQTLYEQAKSKLPSKEALKNVGKSISNPFEAASSFFDEVPIINLNTKGLTIQVPFVYLEDVQRYEVYLNGWIAENSAILAEWENIGRDVAGKCGSKPTETEKQECNNTASKYVDVGVKASALIKSVKQNVKMLQEYKEYPLKLYEYVHAVDKYLTEIICIIDTFIKSTIGWLKSNAKRFEKWVDFIILLIGIIKTWQILIDFSVNWKMMCGKCRQDTYDPTTCILSLLCIDLPILPIPPFKIPDIYIDFSKIGLGIDVLLPTFKFKPTKLPFLKLPNLPRPGSIGLNISLPSIPVLPKLPELPELPSFLPRFKMDLPYLPPAPKIPAIMPAIKAVIEIAEFVGYILCIIKNGIGLVAEWDVKYRIEQLTQRNYGVDPFDSFKITVPKPPLVGYDVRLDSYLNLKFNFDMFYQFAESLKTSVNQSTNTIIKDVGETVLNVNEKSEGIDNSQLNNTQLRMNVDLNSFNYKGTGALSGVDSEVSGMEYKDAYQQLKTGLLYIEEKDTDVYRKNKAKDIVSMIDTPKGVTANVEGIEKVHEDVTKVLQERKAYYNNLADLIKNNYDKFVESLSENDLVSDDDTSRTFSTNLFNGNKEIIDRMKTQENPYKTYIDLNSKWIDKFKNSLETHKAEDLNMTSQVYTNSKNYINKLAAVTNEVKTYFDDNVSSETSSDNISSVKASTDVPLIAQNTAASATSSTSASAGSQQPSVLNGPTEQLVDMTDYINGFFTKGTDGYYHNIIQWEDFANSVRTGKKFEYADMNNDGKDDILIWDGGNIYIKYADENDMLLTSKNQKYSDYYLFTQFNSPQDLLSEVDTDGYYRLGGQKYKIWDDKDAVSNFIRDGQNANTVSFKWINNLGQNDGYVLEFIQRADLYNDKIDASLFNNIAERKYVLVVGTSFDENSSKVNINGMEGIAADLVREGKIIQIIKKDLTDDSSSISIDKNKLADKWYYVRINNLSADQRSIYKNDGPWSYSQVVGAQIWGDNQSPSISINLVRRTTGKLISQGNNLNGYINTHYDLVANASDNTKVQSMWIEYSGAVVKTGDAKTISLDDLYFGTSTQLEYQIGAMDIMGNFDKQTVSLQIDVPSLDINGIDFSQGNLGKITAQLSNDIDDGKVGFEKNRWQFRETLTGSQKDSTEALFDIQPSQTAVEGKFFRLQDEVILYSNSLTPIGKVNLNNGNISIDSKFASNYEINIDTKQKTPLVVIYDKSLKKNIFNIYMKVKALDGTQPVQAYSDYETKKLTGTMYGDYNGGYCIKKRTGDCTVYVSEKGIYIPEPYNNTLYGKYVYSEEKVNYEIYNESGKIANIKFVPNPLK